MSTNDKPLRPYVIAFGGLVELTAAEEDDARTGAMEWLRAQLEGKPPGVPDGARGYGFSGPSGRFIHIDEVVTDLTAVRELKGRLAPLPSYDD